MKQILLISILFIACCTAAFPQSPQCPTIKIYVSDELPRPGSAVGFVAVVQNFSGAGNFTYEWQIRGSLKVISGERSAQMQARRTDDDGGTVNVTLTPFPAGCENHATESISPIDLQRPELIDEFGPIASGLKARVDNLFVRLWQDPRAKGLMVINRSKDSLERARTLVKIMAFRKLDMSLISLVFASEPGDTTRFWLVPDGANEPEIADAVYVRAKDFGNLERIFNLAKKVRKKTK